MSSTPTYLTAEASHRAIEALTDLYVFMEGHPGADLKVLTTEEKEAGRADQERWCDARSTVPRWATIFKFRAEMIGHDPTEEQAAAFSEFARAQDASDGVTIYFDHLRDTTGRMVNAGMLTAEIADQVAWAIHNHWCKA
jgi:hypothetical protein